MLSEEFKRTQRQIENYAKARGHSYIVTEHLLLGLLVNHSAKKVLKEFVSDKKELRTRLINYLNEFLSNTEQHSLGGNNNDKEDGNNENNDNQGDNVSQSDSKKDSTKDHADADVITATDNNDSDTDIDGDTGNDDKKDTDSHINADDIDADDSQNTQNQSTSTETTASTGISDTDTKASTAQVEHSQFYKRVIERATEDVRLSGRNDPVQGVDVLVALMLERDSFAVALLQEYGISRIKLLRYLSEQKRNNDKKGDKIKKNSPLNLYAQNLNERAKAGKTDPLIGRRAEIERVSQILCRRRKNNPLLVGDSGVGKTAIAEGLAWLIVQDKVAKPLKKSTVFSLNVGALVAGTKYRGDFEARMKELIDSLKEQPNAILFIDEIHNVVGAGSSSSGTMDMSNLIKPALANGELRCIGSTTFEEFRGIFEKDGALSRRFQKVDIKEPSIEDSVEILKGLRGYYEHYHKVSYSDEVIQTAVELSVKHIHERFLPDKAIDVLDEVGAKKKFIQHGDDIQIISINDVEEVVASIARIPKKSVESDELATLKHLKDNLKNAVFGQDNAIDKLTDSISLARAGLKSPTKPTGSFMFAGPTGVGKTEIAKTLAELLAIPLVRFDMSEYMEAHTVSRLIGSPPGYVGYDKGGLLTEKVHQNPYCVLLLDELEKAHSDVFNILLQVMDYGKLTDNNGREVSFREVILIMTTNVGADSISRESMGFTRQNHSGDNTEAMKRTFSPEFRNRLDAIVQFAPLDGDVIKQVVDKFLAQLQDLLSQKNVKLIVSDAAKAYLCNKGYDKVMGARPMARLIDDEIKKPLAQELLFGSLANGGTVTVDLSQESVQESTQESVKESLSFDFKPIV